MRRRERIRMERGVAFAGVVVGVSRQCSNVDQQPVDRRLRFGRAIRKSRCRRPTWVDASRQFSDFDDDESFPLSDLEDDALRTNPTEYDSKVGQNDNLRDDRQRERRANVPLIESQRRTLSYLEMRPRMGEDGVRLRNALDSGKREQGEEFLRRLGRRDADKPDGERPRVLIMVGIPGSGKSTMAEMLVARGWKRISQDELGNRYRCEVELIRALLKGQNCVIDRCNFDVDQRRPWIRLARSRGCRVGAIVLATPLEQCIARVRSRESHPTLPPNNPNSEEVVRRFALQFEPPTSDEGIDFARHVRSNTDLDQLCSEMAD
ncbi:Bifunctional polynucleotide phosphatase/kinase [Porphyridium purpureum]|uniref:Bifunctional polynucleotide phosphatase/kinase n=1 Tax=Porphyridium purpureum TaxID=35688 RepID=A0A5J4YL06_PORPP|nr:Bifunctional polynucleotide phosphatase/kinase [Porphyridium purpureum]|eukprot:POR1643..scf244_11